MIFRSLRYPKHKQPFKLLQDYSSTPYIILVCFLAAYLYVLLARHLPMLWPGIGGIFLMTILANAFGLVNARRSFLEAGIEGNFFYLANAYDLIFKKEVEYYPISFSNMLREGNAVIINYKGELVKLYYKDWPRLNEFIIEMETAKQRSEMDLQQ